jgi:hypothetical protein
MTDRLFSQLEEAKLDFGAGAAARVERLLEKLSQSRFQDAWSLIRFHEALLFLLAHPHNPGVLRRVTRLLSTFGERVKALIRAGADPTPFDYIEYSGIAGTVVSGTFSYDIARWLVRRFTTSTDLDWSVHEKKERLGQTLPRFLPLLYEDSLVEANVPYLEWLRAANPRRRDLKWLVDRFERSSLTDKQKAEIYDALELRVRWELGNSKASRTKNKRRVRKIFYHTGPFIRRSDVELEQVIKSPPLVLKKLSEREGAAILDRVRETTTVRYRELYGITHGDRSSVLHTEVGRGVEFFLWGLPPKRRLPLRAYHAGFTLKNGVPVNYIEGITISERMELGFNTFYTFREGESAWVYAQALRLLHQVTGVTCFSIDPYQIGLGNEEAIESGAFWFYRKLGFRPTRSELARLTQREERKLAADRKYRSPARVLRQLSHGHILYELPGTASGDWDRFHIRNIGIAVQRRMAEEFDGDCEKIVTASTQAVARSLNVRLDGLKKPQRQAFEDLSLVLALIQDLGRWDESEKQGVVRIIGAKAGADEARYARRLQRHSRLRESIIRLGSSSTVS